MNTFVKKCVNLAPGIAISLVIGLAAWVLGKFLPEIGGPIFAILLGMLIALAWKKKGAAASGISSANSGSSSWFWIKSCCCCSNWMAVFAYYCSNDYGCSRFGMADE